MSIGDNVILRSDFLNKVRNYFQIRDIYEVQTPMMSTGAAVDVYIDPFVIDNKYYLHTSPELEMKKILLKGSPSIYQLSKVFRKEEDGDKHHPEFTLLEWYRVGWNYHQLMDDVICFFQNFINVDTIIKKTYREAFIESLCIDPFKESTDSLMMMSKQISCDIDFTNWDRDDYLIYLFQEKVEVSFNKDIPTFIYDYPSSQSILSEISKDDPKICKRFELYFKGYELCNGFDECFDHDEILMRFENQNKKRKQLNKEIINIDDEFISLLKNSSLQCAGVAFGVDRLLMILFENKNIKDVIGYRKGKLCLTS